MLNLVSVDIEKEKCPVLAIPVCEDTQLHDNSAIVALVEKAMEYEEFNGEKDEELTLRNPPGVEAARAVFMGVGKIAELKPETLRKITGKAVKKCIKMKIDAMSMVFPADSLKEAATDECVTAMMEGACLANHVFDKYKKEKKLKPLERIDFFAEPDVAERHAGLPKRIETICQGTFMAREWISIPSNEKRPERFIKDIAEVAKAVKLETTIMNEKDLARKKFDAILAVGVGSKNKPGMIVLDYNPKGADKTIALVGKGVTFDSGGINLKTAAGLKDMKSDMSGAAAVAATLVTAAKLKPKNRIVGVIPVVENMPSGNATRPGDIIMTHAGKTVEIGNTDAEGRLILADAISHAVETYKPDMMIDLATLTGACIVALGEKIAGVFSPDDKLAESIVESGRKTHERCWRLPLPEDYKELLKSEIADTNNVSEAGYGGAVTAALFLSEFAGDTKWAHIDIAGPAFAKKAGDYCGPGGTGFGVRLLCDLLEI